MKIKRLFLLISLFVCLPLFLHSQSNMVIDELLEKENAGFGRTSYMVFTAIGILRDDATFEESLVYLNKMNWKMKDRKTEDHITIGEYSYMLMKSFNIDGGIMYRIFQGPRYAARELAYLNFIDNDKSPYRKLSGEEVIRILGRILEWKEANL